MFEAVTTTRSLKPVSAAVGVYAAAFAPARSFHVPPAPERCHWKANDVGEDDHDPVVAVRLRPSWAIPETIGAPVFTGGSGAGRSATS